MKMTETCKKKNENKNISNICTRFVLININALSFLYIDLRACIIHSFITSSETVWFKHMAELNQYFNLLLCHVYYSKLTDWIYYHCRVVCDVRNTSDFFHSNFKEKKKQF